MVSGIQSVVTHLRPCSHERRYACTRMRTLAAMVLLAVVLGGCGSNSSNTSNEYAQAVQQAQFVFSNSFEDATARLESTSEPAADAQALRDAAKAVAEDVKTLTAITPPKEVRALHAKLIAVMTVYGRSVRNVATLVGTGKPQAFPKAKNQLTKSSAAVRTHFNQIIQQINTALS